MVTLGPDGDKVLGIVQKFLHFLEKIVAGQNIPRLDVHRIPMLRQNTGNPIRVRTVALGIADEKIARWIMDSNSKQELNNHLQEMFQNKEVKYIFTRLRDLTYNL